MSYLWNAHGSSAALDVDPVKMKEAELQFDAMTLLYQRIIYACESKCVYRYGEPELTKGELCCIDRCVSKYMTANQTVGLKIKELEIDPMATNAALVQAANKLQ